MAEISYLWPLFCEIKNSCENVITFRDIKAYCELTGEILEPWEVRAIRYADDAKRQEDAKQWQT